MFVAVDDFVSVRGLTSRKIGFEDNRSSYLTGYNKVLDLKAVPERHINDLGGFLTAYVVSDATGAPPQAIYTGHAACRRHTDRPFCSVCWSPRLTRSYLNVSKRKRETFS
ncbi:MAG TPA: hypothetical protein VK658_16185 [Chryseolinea sp.]|nr:hypothetical protein [Chryseolinea sp.]